jgi:hypothetical protein
MLKLETWQNAIMKVGVVRLAKELEITPMAVWRWVKGTAKPYGENRRKLCDFMRRELPAVEFEGFLESLSSAILGGITQEDNAV